MTMGKGFSPAAFLAYVRENREAITEIRAHWEAILASGILDDRPDLVHEVRGHLKAAAWAETVARSDDNGVNVQPDSVGGMPAPDRTAVQE